MRLVGIILARNEAKHVADCVKSLLWTDEVIVFESMGSTDNTVELAEQAGARVIQNRFENFAQQRNDAMQAVDADWILFVDADERVSPELAEEIQRVLENPQHDGYYIPRHNYIFGHVTLHAGWYPDYQMRLLNRQNAHYDPEVRVHEVVILANDGKAGHLETPLIHYNYETVRQFIKKQRYYAAFDAEIMYQQGIRPKPHNYILQPYREFKRRFIEHQGYKMGLHGLLLGLLMMWNEFDKYLNLRKLWRASSPAK